MSEINRPEDRIDSTETTKTSPEALRNTEARKDSIENDLDSMSGEEKAVSPEHKNTEVSPTSEREDKKQEHFENNLEAAGRNEGKPEGSSHREENPDRPPPGDGGDNPERMQSHFSRENFKVEDSFDYRSKAVHPELNDLKNKCSHDVQPMGTPDNQIDKTPKAEYTPEECSNIKGIRDGVDAPTKDTVMQKVVGVDTGDARKDLSAYLEPKGQNGKPTEAQVYGFVSKAEDSAQFTKTPKECHDNLRLDYSGTQYQNPEQSVYVLRYTDGKNYDTPYSKEFGGNKEREQPCTGNGFTASKDVNIPEYEVRQEKGRGAVVTDGEIYRVNPDGTEEKVAYYDDESRKFKLCEKEAEV